MRRVLAAAMAATVLGGCQVLAILTPTTQLQLTNQSSLAVTVRIGAFKAGTTLVTAAQAQQTFQLAPTEDKELQLPVGHYTVYAEANTPEAQSAGSDVVLKAGTNVTMDLQQRVEDHLPSQVNEGQRVLTLGWAQE